MIVNRTQLADVFGVSLPTIDAWRTAGMPVVQRGARGIEWQFDTAAVAKWRQQRALEDATGDQQQDEAEIERRTKRAKMLQAELELAEAKKLVADVQLMERNLARAFAVIRADLRNIPSRVVSLLIGEHDERRFKATLLQEIDQALASLSTADLTAQEAEEEETEG